MIRATRLDHVHLHVDEVEPAIAFYRHVFGAKEAFRVGERLVFLRIADAVIALDGRPECERNPQHFALAAAEATDLDAAIADVERAGGRLLERGEHAPGVPYAYVADPAGNVVEL